MVFKVTGAITNASGYTKVTLVYIDSAGTFTNNDKFWVAFTASGEDGAIPGYLYKFATSTTDGDPGAGILRFNNATYANVTEIYIDDADANGGATQADTATWGSSTSTIKGFIHIVDINDSSTYARFKVTAAVDDESGYNKITVVHLASNNTFSATDELSVHFTRTGLKGDTGATGSTGSQGPTGDVSLAGTQTLTNKTLTSPKINEDVAVTSTATELNLLDGVSGLVQADLTKLAAIDATAAELDNLDALSRGSLIYGNASAATAILTKGSADTVLTSDGTDIAWSAAAGGGKVLQVVSAAKTDTFATNATSFTDVTGITVSITPSATSSKILILTDLTCGSGNTNAFIQLLRGSTAIYIGDAGGDRTRAKQSVFISDGNSTSQETVNFLDSPSSTSAVTYKIQARVNDSSYNLCFNRTQNDNDLVSRVRGASSITVMEIGA